jgi:hypothetical protein
MTARSSPDRSPEHHQARPIPGRPDAPVSGPLHAFDPSVPQSARIYDAWLGGKDHYEVDRDVAARVIERRPQVIAAARGNRLFLNRAVRYMAQRHAVTQFLDIGAGMCVSYCIPFRWWCGC